MNLAPILNTAWLWKCGAEARAFAGMTQRVASVQAGVLRSILTRNRDTAFGTAHHFDRLSDPRAYQERVPLSTYEDYAPAIARIAAGERNVLTRERVLLLEPTSGTTGGEKLIPYTASLRRQFQRAVAVWIADLFGKRPAVRRGPAYWSISPAFGPPRLSAGGIPIGFDDDTAYLGAAERWLVQRVLAVPSAVARIEDVATFRYITLLFLLQARDLALVSVWNPTFLTSLLASFREWSKRLCDDLRRGTISPPTGCAFPDSLRVGIRANPRRAAEVASIRRECATAAEAVRMLWPGLALISCWTDAAAARSVADLRQLFPHVEIQPKGLLATEAVVSIPLIDRSGAALALGSHFFEFQEADEQRRCRLAHELDLGGRYRVVVTTGGGLYRYQLQDEVEVVGFEQQCPRLRFLGKADRTSDLVGEKLAEPFVRAAVERCLGAVGIRARFALVVPMVSRPAFYRLYLQGDGVPHDAGRLAALAAALEDELEANPHYRYAVQMGQLRWLEVVALDPAAEPAERIVERRLVSQGQKVGAIKPAALDAWTGWAELFAPLTASASSGRTPVEPPAIPAQSR